MSTPVIYRVNGMTCGGCARSVARAITTRLPELGVDVDLRRGTVRITGEHEQEVIREAVEQAGFQLVGLA